MPPAAPVGQSPLQIVPQPPDPQGGPFGRIVAFFAIVAVAALWLQHHLGFEFEKLGVIAVATAVWGVMGKVADWVDEKSAMGRFIDAWFKTPLRFVLRHMTRPAPLYGTAVIVGALMATVSSVTVRSSTPGERAAVSLASLDSRGTPRTDTLTRDKAAVRFLPILTSPFGRIYEVDADGYVPSQVTVYPLVSRQIVLGRDLAASPSVLFRPFDEGVVALEDSADFQVSRLRDGRWERLAVITRAASPRRSSSAVENPYPMPPWSCGRSRRRQTEHPRSRDRSCSSRGAAQNTSDTGRASPSRLSARRDPAAREPQGARGGAALERPVDRRIDAGCYSGFEQGADMLTRLWKCTWLVTLATVSDGRVPLRRSELR